MRFWVSARMETSAWMVMALPPAASALALVSCGLFGVVAVVDDYGCAFAGEADGDGLADAGAGAGDDGDFVLQSWAMGLSSVACRLRCRAEGAGGYFFTGIETARPGVTVIFFGEVALVEREGDAAARVDVEERAADGDVAEGFDEGDGVGVAVDGDGDGVAEVIAEFGEGFGRDIEDDVAEGAVEAEDFAVEAGGVEGGVVDVEADEFGDVEGGAGLGPVVAAGEMGSGGREDVAAVEGGGEIARRSSRRGW